MIRPVGESANEEKMIECSGGELATASMDSPGSRIITVGGAGVVRDRGGPGDGARRPRSQMQQVSPANSARQAAAMRSRGQ